MVTGTGALIAIFSTKSAIHKLVKLKRLSNGRHCKRRCRGCYKKIRDDGHTATEARRRTKQTVIECDVCKETYYLTCFYEVH